MGVVADTFWRMPGARRSDSPHAFAALGPERIGSRPRIRGTSRTAWTARSGASTSCENFALVDGWLDENGRQRRGRVGYVEARLASAREIVTSVTDRLRTNETVFLHEPGVDAECEDARASIRNPPAAPTDASARRAPSTKFGPD
jgi:aminoglycoside N3'-acetyltransferase